MSALTSSNTITLGDDRKFRVYTHDNLARVDTGEFGDGLTIARFYSRGRLGWEHRESNTIDRDPVTLAVRLLREGTIG